MVMKEFGTYLVHDKGVGKIAGNKMMPVPILHKKMLLEDAWLL